MGNETSAISPIAEVIIRTNRKTVYELTNAYDDGYIGES